MTDDDYRAMLATPCCDGSGCPLCPEPPPPERPRDRRVRERLERQEAERRAGLEREIAQAKWSLQVERGEEEGWLIGSALDEVMAELPRRQADRADAEWLWQELSDRGVALAVRHGRLRCDPANAVPADLAAEVERLRAYLEDLCDERAAGVPGEVVWG